MLGHFTTRTTTTVAYTTQAIYSLSSISHLSTSQAGLASTGGVLSLRWHWQLRCFPYEQHHFDASDFQLEAQVDRTVITLPALIHQGSALLALYSKPSVFELITTVELSSSKGFKAIG